MIEINSRRYFSLRFQRTVYISEFDEKVYALTQKFKNKASHRFVLIREKAAG
jgi:hypothetical protein